MHFRLVLQTDRQLTLKWNLYPFFAWKDEFGVRQ